MATENEIGNLVGNSAYFVCRSITDDMLQECCCSLKIHSSVLHHSVSK